MHQLADQSLPACHIGVGFHPHRAVRDPLPALYSFLDLCKQLGIIFPAHLIRCRLTLDKFVLGIFLDQAQLGSKSPLRFAVRLRHRPEPSQIKVRIAHGVEHRRTGSVSCLHHRAERFPCFLIRSDPLLPGLFKIDDQRELLQSLCYFRRPEGRFIQSGQKPAQRVHVHVQLIGVLVPDPVSTFSQNPPLSLHCGIRIGAWQHGTRCAASAGCFRVEMPRIGLHQQVIPFPALRAETKYIVLHKMMGLVHPGSAVCAKRLPVHKQCGLPVRFQIHHDPFALRLRRQRDTAPKPAVLPDPAPRKTGAYRGEISLLRLLGRQIFHRGKSFQRDLPKRHIQIIFQGAHPMRNPVSPFRMH